MMGVRDGLRRTKQDAARPSFDGARSPSSWTVVACGVTAAMRAASFVLVERESV
jgi:hypothetical protein